MSSVLAAMRGVITNYKWLVLAASAILIGKFRYEIFAGFVWPSYCYIYKSIFGSSYLYIDEKAQTATKQPMTKVMPKQSADSVRFVVSSDTHFFHDYMDIPDGDVFIHCGDILLVDPKSYKQNKPLSINKIYQFKNWLNTLPHQYKIIIAGNHDNTFELLGRDKVRDILSNDNESSLIDNNSIIYLDNEEYTLDIKKQKIKLYGSPSSIFGHNTHTPNKAFQLDRDEIREKVWDKIPNDTDILITHQHPSDEVSGIKSGKNGCKDLTNKIERDFSKCRYHLYGHYHFGYGVTFGDKKRFKNDERDTVCFVNAAALTGKYMYGNYPVVFDYV